MCPHLSSNSCPPLRVSASLSTLSVSVSKKKHSSPRPCPRPCPRPRPRHMPAFHARAHARVPCPHPLLNFTFSWVFGKIERKKLKPTFVQNSISKYKKALYKADDNHATYIYEVKTWNSWVPRYSIFIYTLSFDVILWNILSWRIPRRIPWRCCWIPPQLFNSASSSQLETLRQIDTIKTFNTAPWVPRRQAWDK